MGTKRAYDHGSSWGSPPEIATRRAYYSARSLRWPAVDTSDVQATMVFFYAETASKDEMLPANLSDGSNMFWTLLWGGYSEHI